MATNKNKLKRIIEAKIKEASELFLGANTDNYYEFMVCKKYFDAISDIKKVLDERHRY